MPILLKSINRFVLIQLLCRAHRLNTTSRSICMKTGISSHSFLSPDNSRVVDGLIFSFTRRPFYPDSPEVRDFGSKLTPGIVETVLKNLKSWQVAQLFFSWASNQCGYKHNCYTYNAMASILSGARQNAPLRALAMELVNSRPWMTPGALGHFIRCLGGQGLVEEAIFLFDEVKKKGLCVPNNYSYNCLLEAISKSTSVELIETKLKEMRDLGWEPDKYTLTPLLQCYCNGGHFDKALEVFNRIYEQGWVDSYVLAILSISFSKWGEIDKAFELIERMEVLNVYLNEKTFCLLIHGSVRESRADKAFQLFDKMQKLGFIPDISIFGVLVEGICKNKELEKALYLCSEMKDLGLHPDVKILGKLISTFPGEREVIKLLEEMPEDLDTETMKLLFNSVLNGLVTNGSIDKAHYLLQATMSDESNGDVEVDKLFRTMKFVHPDSNSFEIVINAMLCTPDNLDKALGLFQDMDRVNCGRSLSLYNNVIECMSNTNRLEECYELLREMKASGFQPTQFTYNSIFGCLCQREDIVGALGTVKEMRVHGHEPWIKHTTLLVKKLCNNGRAAEAANFLGSMVQEGFLPDIVAYSAAISGLFKIKEVDQALQLFRDIGTRGCGGDVVAYNTLINGLCKATRVEQAQDFLKEMLDKGLVPSVVNYNSLIDGWCKSGDIDRAKLCLSMMVSKEVEPNVITYTTLIDGSCNAGRPSDAIELWNQMREKGCSPNGITFMALINGLCKCGTPDDALVYFQDMEEKGIKPDMFVYVSLVEAFISNSKPLLAIDMLKRMLLRGFFPDSLDKKNCNCVREAVFKLSKDPRTSSDIQSLIAEGSIPLISVISDVGSENGSIPFLD